MGSDTDPYRLSQVYAASTAWGSQFADFDIPWNIDLNYSFGLQKTFDLLSKRFKTSITQSVSLNASTNLTEKWKIGLNTTVDLTKLTIGQAAVYITRDLHCWQMAINISPVGVYRYFSINISPKSPILRDLKVNRTRTFTDF